MTGVAFIRQTLAINGFLSAGLVAVAALILDTRATLGTLIGGALGIANLATLSWLGLKLFSRRSKLCAVLMALKFVLFMTLLYFVVRYVPMAVGWFVTGISASVLAVMASATLVAARGSELNLDEARKG